MESTEIYKVTYEEDINAVFCKWYGYATSNQFRESTELLLEMLEKHNAHKILVDLKDMILIGKEDQDWMDRTYIPKATTLGLKFVACIQPLYFFNKIAVESIVYSFNKTPVTVNYFENYEDAIDWLKNMQD